ncbi:MAG: FAD-dependent oxidoreductase [Anaerolineae bacterium]
MDTRVVRIEPSEHGRYRVTTDDGETLDADALVLTTPAYTTADLIRPLASDAADRLRRSATSAPGRFRWHTRRTRSSARCTAWLVVPSSERRPINAITISSISFDHRAPEGYALLRVFFGGSRSPETMTYDDDRLLAVVRQELRAILESRPRRCSTGFTAGSAPTHSTMSGIWRWSRRLRRACPTACTSRGAPFGAWGCRTACIRRSKRSSGCWNA